MANEKVTAAAEEVKQQGQQVIKVITGNVASIPDKLIRVWAVAMTLALAAGVLLFQCQGSKNDSKLVELQNQIALRDKTIEVQKDVYTKLDVAVTNVKSALDTSQEEVKRLADELKKTHADLLAVQNVVVAIKKQTASGSGQQHQVDPVKPGGEPRTQVDFHQDFGFVAVDGSTLTNPPEYKLQLGPGTKPLRLTLTLSQSKDKSWRTMVASSDPNVALEVGSVAVNPYILQEKWYERLKLTGDLGAGGAILAGAGVLIPCGGKLECGPHIWWTPKTGTIYGATATWAPFKRN